MGTIMWGKEVAEAYDATSADMFDPAVLDPTVTVLTELADGGRALELAIGTGRVALPLSERGIEVHGIELSPHMVEQLRDKPGADSIGVTAGDMTTSSDRSRGHTIGWWSAADSSNTPRRTATSGPLSST